LYRSAGRKVEIFALPMAAFYILLPNWVFHPIAVISAKGYCAQLCGIAMVDLMSFGDI
jgi:hypothetical protein